jgi:hypothetical protein
LVQLQLNFRARPTAFRLDTDRVTYALSFLQGTALDFFEPAILELPHNPPSWVDDYDDFISELKTNFGPQDPEGEAEVDIEALRMRDNQKIVKYVIEFNRLRSQLSGYGNAALARAFYRGLPARIKNEFAHIEKPRLLSELIPVCQRIDGRYWEYEAERARDKSSDNKNSRGDKSDRSDKSDKDKGKSNNDKSSDKNNKNNSGNRNQQSGNRNNNKSSGSNNNKSNNSAGSSSERKGPDLTGKLGKDGKLTQEERQRRMDNNLCLFCGGGGHKASDCPKSTSSAAKARASKTSDPKSDSTDSKN